MIKVSPKSMAELVKRGSHPQYGARALKRVVESEIAQPLAENLSQLPPRDSYAGQFHLSEEPVFSDIWKLFCLLCNLFPGQKKSKIFMNQEI